MKFETAWLQSDLLWSLELQTNRTNLKPSSHIDILGFSLHLKNYWIYLDEI
jgi:hypothetical protein